MTLSSQEPLPITQTSQPGSTKPQVHVKERPAWKAAPALMLTISLVLLLGSIAAFVVVIPQVDVPSPSPIAILGIVATILAFLVSLLLLTSFVINSPGETRVVQFFGRYIGTVRETGIFFVAPLSNRSKILVRVRNFETSELKVNDADGNPINIAAVVVWQVADTAKASFAVEDYEAFVKVQAEAALRHVAMSHPYDSDENERSLRGATDLVSQELAIEVDERVAVAGVEIVEVRISHLAYSSEIAQAMLQRQQAGAIIAARELIVEGAVTMVQQALTRLEDEDIVNLDDERRATMVSNLLVVLCGESRATPVINTGSLYS